LIQRAGIGAVRFRALLDFFGNAQTAWHAPTDALANAGLSERVIQNLVQVRSQVSLEKIWQHIQTLGIQVLTWEDNGYPRHLHEIDQPPPVIYSRGSFTPEDEWAVAVVGTRRMTVYGRQVEEIASVLARNGVTVVSGWRAAGCSRHQAALNAGGARSARQRRHCIYPPEKLADQIIHQGAGSAIRTRYTT
jgi:DNA processing protein